MASFSDHRPVRIGRTTNRQLGFITPSASDEKCEFFKDRFIRHGSALKENRAICEKKNNGIICDYQKEIGGVPFCLRYWYGPQYEIVDELPHEPYEQKVDAGRNLLYYAADGVTETTAWTPLKVMIPLSEMYPIKYVKDNLDQKKTMLGIPLFWDRSGIHPVETIVDTGEPVLMPNSALQFYSTQYEDTHEKIFSVRGNVLGWHND